jgi:hypothetical protein
MNVCTTPFYLSLQFCHCVEGDNITSIAFEETTTPMLMLEKIGWTVIRMDKEKDTISGIDNTPSLKVIVFDF